eukprot:TRINITY_DN781835_c0_g1_i1.p1 TRINITY_DN781835_c0_g1~~TRINITY_DN781835_c0_g1_i1.p1  ORF type:complete len:230 (-),score=54.06 TRINITY_DN781835_c0_g1_i1:176-865(-)
MFPTSKSQSKRAKRWMGIKKSDEGNYERMIQPAFNRINEDRLFDEMSGVSSNSFDNGSAMGHDYVSMDYHSHSCSEAPLFNHTNKLTNEVVRLKAELELGTQDHFGLECRVEELEQLVSSLELDLEKEAAANHKLCGQITDLKQEIDEKNETVATEKKMSDHFEAAQSKLARQLVQIQQQKHEFANKIRKEEKKKRNILEKQLESALKELRLRNADEPQRRNCFLCCFG